ncbi:EKA-like protein [Blumeria hordei DH14]|uniref:EKA-like protein n=1 Tax=Blumeria graminis f. sp. hordei (strain DH14) TaxID=546991 RepID=N1JCF0_BLUG1|nr:EKA-like protein [Blumeria hordei DH14]
MPLVRVTKRQHSLVDYAKLRLRSRLLDYGINIDEMDIYNAEDAITTKVMDAPEIEMMGKAFDEFVTKGLSDSIWDAPTNPGSSEPTKQTEKLIPPPTTPRSSVTSSRKIAAFPTKLPETDKITMAPSNAAPDKSLERGSEVEQEPNISTIPEEMAVLVENEKRRAAKAAANISICSSTINIVENHLSPMLMGENKNFINSFRVYLRASIAQFIHVGPGATPPLLPKVPAIPQAKLIASTTVETYRTRTAAPSGPKANYWAAIVSK